MAISAEALAGMRNSSYANRRKSDKQLRAEAEAKASKEAAGQKYLKSNYKYGEYVPLDTGEVTHDAQGREVALKRQAHIQSWRETNNGEVTGRKYAVADFDKGWDDYNKTLKEMRHRVQFGVRNRRKLEVGARAGKFGAGQAQRVSAAQRGGMARAGTLLSNAFDE